MTTFRSLTSTLALSALLAMPALAQPGKTTPENPRNPDAPATPAAAKPAPSAEQKETLVYVMMSTTAGDMVIALNQTKAPISTANFVKYMDAGHYNGTVFHRVIPGFMIQGGGFDKDMNEKGDKFPPIKNEFSNGLKNARGTIAMARTNSPDSATSQFFINVNNNAALDRARPDTGGAGYAVFGEVISGMDVADKIVSVKTGNRGGNQNVPVEPIVITTVRAATPDEVAKAKPQ